MLGVSSFGRGSGPPWNLHDCGCWSFCGLTGIPAAMLFASFDRSYALCTSAIFVNVRVFVGHFNSSPAVFGVDKAA